MHVDKAKKRIAKQVKKGFHGYPLVSLEYFGEEYFGEEYFGEEYFGKEHFGKTPDSATQVVISFIEEEGADPQKQTFVSAGDARDDETIQSALLKIIERADAKTVIEIDGVSTLSEN